MANAKLSAAFDATPLSADADDELMPQPKTPEPKTVVADADAKDPRKTLKKANVPSPMNSANAARKRYGARVGRDVSAVIANPNLFEAPPLKSRRDEAPAAVEITEDNYGKLLSMRDNMLILKLCRQCQAVLFADKAKFRFKEGRVYAEINFCENCADGNIVAADAGESFDAEIYEAELYKLVKVNHGVILSKLCDDCAPLLRVSVKEGGLRAEIAFCRLCCRRNMGLSEALTRYFPYKADSQPLTGGGGGIIGRSNRLGY